MAHKRLAVLIDSDNVSDENFDFLFKKIEELGNVALKRIYGDFTSPNNARWKAVLNKYAIRPISQFAYTAGKNATDIALVIDAVDLLHQEMFDGFCLVSGDSDYTPLVLRIKEQGLNVYGFGEQKKTSEAFRNACSQFFHLDDLKPKTPEPSAPKAAVPAPITKAAACTVPQAASKKSDLLNKQELCDLLIWAVEEARNPQTGIANISTIGSKIRKKMPEFNVKQYKQGKSPLTALFRDRPNLFELGGKQGVITVKLKKK